jgi:hypothetical protein
MHKESHQHIDVVSMLRPLTKWNARLNSSTVIPEVVRKAFKVAQEQKPGPTHIELPEDVMGETVDAEPLPSHMRRRRLEPGAQEVLQAAELIRGAANPIVLAGNGVARTGAAAALREFARSTGIGVAETFMGKGVLDYEDPRALGTGLRTRSWTGSGSASTVSAITSSGSSMCVGPGFCACATLNALRTTSGITREDCSRTFHFVTGRNIETTSMCWCDSLCIRSRSAWPVSATSGERSRNASATPVIRFVAPGPSVPRQTPARRVSLPYMSAM